MNDDIETKKNEMERSGTKSKQRKQNKNKRAEKMMRSEDIKNVAKC